MKFLQWEDGNANQGRSHDDDLLQGPHLSSHSWLGCITNHRACGGYTSRIILARALETLFAEQKMLDHSGYSNILGQSNGSGFSILLSGIAMYPPQMHLRRWLLEMPDQ